jgi:CMP-N,N'-diacetyllegionaminic acid synthase
MNILSIIPARGGSKGIPRKNVKLIAGKPLIAWTIETALALQAIDRVLVSTDDVEITETARQWGADVPFLRPEPLSSDTAKSIDVVLHALDWLKNKENYSPDFVLLLQPTSPFRSVLDIQAAIELQKEKGADAVVGVCELPHPLSWVREVEFDGKLLPPQDTGFAFRRQDARKLYQLNGALYFIKPDVLQKERTFLPEKTYAHIMPVERSLDIDTPWDFYLADLILRDKNGN